MQQQQIKLTNDEQFNRTNLELTNSSVTAVRLTDDNDDIFFFVVNLLLNNDHNDQYVISNGHSHTNNRIQATS